MPLATLVTAMLLPGLVPGDYSNEEQVYFERDAGRTAPPLALWNLRWMQASCTIDGAIETTSPRRDAK